MYNSINKTEFLKRALKKNNEKYDYSEIEFKSMQENITVRCNLHNILFTQTPLNHLRTTGCPKCSHEKRKLGKRISKEEFIKRSNIIHNNKYDYSNIDFVDIETPILIKCAIHNTFLQRPTDHLAKCGCKKCGYIKNSKNSKLKTTDFIDSCNKIHNFKYDYSLIEYKTRKDKISVICPIHGIFQTLAGDHKSGKTNCRKCNYDYNTFRKSGWIKKAKDRKGIFYIIKCWNDQEIFYKLGITSTSIKDRYRGKFMPYNYEIIREIISEDLGYIWDLEKRFKRIKQKQHYNPLIKFGGSKYECFK